MDRMWYETPARGYTDGLPIGTGRLAAMVLGDPKRERVALNHEWLWRGVNRCRETKESAHLLDEVRRLLLSGDHENGTIKGNEAFGGPGGAHPERLPNHVDSYQPAGDFVFELDHGEVSDYRRELNMEDAVVTVSYQSGGAMVRREYIAHAGYDIILVRIRADRPISGTFSLVRLLDKDCFLHLHSSDTAIMMDGLFEEGTAFRVQCRVEFHNGDMSIQKGQVRIDQATEMIFSLNVGTSATGNPPAAECGGMPVPAEDWDAIFAVHRDAFHRFYSGLALEVDLPELDVPTDRRLRDFREGSNDPGLVGLYFNYGRYLLVASTARGALPPNLQGKWNEQLAPPWESDYHHDMNLQMNYWFAEAGNLSFATESLFRHMERFVPHGRKAARDLYGCDGIVFPIQTDVWGRCTPESYGWAVWIGAAAWLAQHMWWHYEYGQDLVFLKERAYPFFKEVAAFYESYVIEDGEGTLQLVPSQSPENRFVGGGPLPVTLCVSSTMDVVLAKDALGYALRSAELLGLDADKQAEWRSMLGKLPGYQVGKAGQLLEWNQEFEEGEPGHRHLSHLIGMFPGDSLDPEKTPQLWQAGRASLEQRLAAGGAHCGWSRAWVACLYARMGAQAEAWYHLCRMISEVSSDSLLNLIIQVFEVDTNFGGTAAVLEMLFQIYHEEIHFLPALPEAWPKGSLRGVRARGGFEVDMKWVEGALAEAEIRASVARRCTILHAAGKFVVTTETGEKVDCRTKGHRLAFDAAAGGRYRVKRIAPDTP